MTHESNRRDHLWAGIFALLSLAVPALVGYDIYIQWRTPVIDFVLDWETGVILDVHQNTYADYAGFWVGDVLVSVGGVPFDQWYDLQVGNHITEIERGGQLLTMELPVVPLLKTNLLPLVSGVFVALTFWGISMALLLRRFQQQEIRLIFLLGQTMAITLLFPMAHPNYWTAPFWARFLSLACLFLSAPLVLHYYLTFPAILGTVRQRRWGLSLLYLLALASIAGWLDTTTTGVPLGRQLGILYLVFVIGAALVVMSYVYLRLATPDDRRRLRIVVLSTIIAAMPAIAFYLAPNFLGLTPLMPVWLVGLLVVVAPISYLYATVRHSLFDIDHLLNRTLVYAILSLGILLLYLGPLLLIYRFSPGDLLAQMLIAAGLTLIVGLAFEWSRVRVQRFVDHLFYGGWYDYPGVVETISDALTRSIEREQIFDVLTRQVPELMQLSSGHLWIGEPNATYPQTPPLQERFRFKFQSDVPAQWTVGPHRDGDDLSEADRRILKTLALQAEIALNNVLLIETLRRQLDEIHASREALTQTQRQLLRSREEERARLARDLHDSPIQTLVGLNIQLGLLSADPPLLMGRRRRLGVREGEGLRESLREMRAEVRKLLAELRQVCTDLRPPMLDALGLGAALRAHAEEWSEESGVQTLLDMPDDSIFRTLPDEVAVNLYRVAQEALVNVERHARAALVNIHLAYDANRLEMSIQDDGQGFTLPDTLHNLPKQDHFGLVGMRERVELIGGEWQLESAPGGGTRVQVVWGGRDQ